MDGIVVHQSVALGVRELCRQLEYESLKCMIKCPFVNLYNCMYYVCIYIGIYYLYPSLILYKIQCTS